MNYNKDYWLTTLKNENNLGLKLESLKSGIKYEDCRIEVINDIVYLFADKYFGSIIHLLFMEQMITFQLAAKSTKEFMDDMLEKAVDTIDKFKPGNEHLDKNLASNSDLAKQHRTFKSNLAILENLANRHLDSKQEAQLEFLNEDLAKVIDLARKLSKEISNKNTTSKI